MKVKISRGIATKLICCTALVVLSSAVAFSAAKPTSGALVSVDGTAGSATIHIKLYDSQIHSGTVQVLPVDGTQGSACSSLAGDNIPTDAYVLQGGSATGCDPGDNFEVTDDNPNNSPHQASGTANLSGFKFETHYRSEPIVSITNASHNGDASTTTYTYTRTVGPDLANGETIVVSGMADTANDGTFTNISVSSGTFTVSNTLGSSSSGTENGTGTVSGAVCNTSGLICAGPDTGFITVTNNTGSAFTGTISLTGTSPTAGGFCPTGGMASDSATNLGVGGSVTLALSTDSSNCGGFNQAQLLNLAQNATSTAFFGKDDYQIKPLNSAANDTLSVLPIPVPAGPVVSGSFGSESVGPSALRFSAGANFSNTTSCVPYADFSAPGNPVCVELQLTPGGPSNDAGNYLYTAQNDYNIDANSFPNGIGGPAFLGHHGVSCPDSGFDLNIFTSYTAPTATFGDPTKGGGSGTGSCWVVAFDANANAIHFGDPPFSSFVGLLSPVSDTDLNLVKPGSAIPVIWQLFKSPGVPLIENLSFCPSSSGSGCATPWVFVGTIATSCMADNTPNTATETSSTMSTVGTVVQNSQNGTYQVNLKTAKGSTGCFDVVLIFDNGVAVYPANFKYTK
jgi:hypothetical protein